MGLRDKGFRRNGEAKLGRQSPARDLEEALFLTHTGKGPLEIKAISPFSRRETGLRMSPRVPREIMETEETPKVRAFKVWQALGISPLQY